MSVFCGTFAVLTTASVVPATADDAVPLASVARDLGYHYAYLPLENVVSLTRSGSVITVRPGDAFFTINDRREPVYGFVPFYKNNDVVVSPAFEAEIRPIARKVAMQEREARAAAEPAPTPFSTPDAGLVRSVAAYFLRSASAVEIFGKATPGTHVSVVLRANVSENVPVITVDGADAVAGPDGSFYTRLNGAPDHFTFSRFFIEAKAPGDPTPAVVQVTNVSPDKPGHTKADEGLK